MVEKELFDWLCQEKVWLLNELLGSNPERIVDETLVISEAETGPVMVEISRSPANLCWHVRDGFTRFLVHTVARYWNIVSFS